MIATITVAATTVIILFITITTVVPAVAELWPRVAMVGEARSTSTVKVERSTSTVKVERRRAVWRKFR
jgi:hypothetical protein